MIKFIHINVLADGDFIQFAVFMSSVFIRLTKRDHAYIINVLLQPFSCVIRACLLP